MKESGKLDKYGRANEATPAAWKKEYKDFNEPLAATSNAQTEGGAIEAAPVKEGHLDKGTELPSKAEMADAPAVPPTNIDVSDDGDKKKKRKHDGETAEEKAERKKAKKEKKEKKEKRKSVAKDDSDSD
jgi:H/ACA ribonucleoprotein complex subunit 4